MHNNYFCTEEINVIANNFYDIVIDLLPGRMYTVFVSSVTSFTDQLPDNMFSMFSASDQTTISGSMASTGAVATSPSSSASYYPISLCSVPFVMHLALYTYIVFIQ